MKEVTIFNCYLTAPRPTFSHYRGGSLNHLMLITAFSYFLPQGQRESQNEVGSLSPTQRLVEFELGTFRLWLQRLNPLRHAPKTKICAKENTLTENQIF